MDVYSVLFPIVGADPSGCGLCHTNRNMTTTKGRPCRYTKCQRGVQVQNGDAAPTDEL